MPAPILIDIFSDPICPWCYIGLKRLDAALAQTDRAVQTRWRCFMLNPDMPAEGMDRRTYLERKFGGPQGADRVYGAIEQAAKQAGLQVDFAKIARTPSTIAAHMALREAQFNEAEGAQADALVRALFAAYFEEGRDIGDPDILAQIWQDAGFAPDRLAAVLAEDHHREDIIEENRVARSRGISGVPFFIIAGTYALSGAQDTAALTRVFDLIDQEAA